MSNGSTHMEMESVIELFRSYCGDSKLDIELLAKQCAEEGELVDVRRLGSLTRKAEDKAAGVD